jgi:hypothetical protein
MEEPAIAGTSLKPSFSDLSRSSRIRIALPAETLRL